MFYWLIKNLYFVFAKTYLDYKVIHRDRIMNLEPGGYVVASNHVSFLDPPLVGISFPENIHYFARKTLFEHPVFAWGLRKTQAIPVNQEHPEMSTLKHIINLLKDGEKVVIFPEGERTPNGQLKEKGAAGVGMIVNKSHARVLPVRLFGPEKALPRDAKKVTKVPVTLVIGEPLDFSEVIANKDIRPKLKYEQITAEIMEAIRSLECPEDRLP